MQNKKPSVFITAMKGCFVLLMITIFLAGAGASITLAKSGLVEIPVLSRALYSPPLPTREVPKIADRDVLVGVQMKLLQVERLPRGATEIISFTEAEITALLRNKIEQGAAGWPVSDLQLVFLEGKVEARAISESRQNVPILMVFVPTLTADSVALHVEKVRFGDIGVPAFVLNVAMETLAAPKLEEMHAYLFDPARKGVNIKSLAVKEGILELTVRNQ